MRMFSEKGLIQTNNIYQKIALISLTVSIFSSFSFLISYSFLYGYYFGGSLDFSSSNFDIYLNFIPFQFQTMTFTWLMLSLSISLLIFMSKIIIEKEFQNILLVLISFIILHILLTVFFTRQVNDVLTILQFGVIWAIPFFILLMVFFVVRVYKVPLKSFAGSLYGLIGIMFLIIINHWNTADEWVMLLVYFAFFAGGISFSYISYNKYSNVAFFFPYYFIILILIYSLYPIQEFFNSINIMGVVIVCPIAMIISYFTAKKKKLVDVNSNNVTDKHSVFIYLSTVLNEFLNKKTNNKLIMLIMLMLLGAFIIIPRISIYTAKVIRSFTPVEKLQQNIIKMKDIEGRVVKFKGKVVADQNNILFISNENWQLEQVKTEKYIVEINEKD
ncbi:hypothetical protein ACTSEZ_20995 [Metabacillus sp. JX24]|uniref:hypothetical protein n=1 Tax=Metabacillus sp. JX24 TaxID=3240759 RepID=UPI00350F6F50